MNLAITSTTKGSHTCASGAQAKTHTIVHTVALSCMHKASCMIKDDQQLVGDAHSCTILWVYYTHALLVNQIICVGDVVYDEREVACPNPASLLIIVSLSNGTGYPLKPEAHRDLRSGMCVCMYICIYVFV